MYVVITQRSFKSAVQPGADRFAARSTTVLMLTVSGPFKSSAVAQKAALVALKGFTCLSAQVWSETAIAAKIATGRMRFDEEKAMHEAKNIIAASKLPIA